jgi:hypothetical protein
LPVVWCTKWAQNKRMDFREITLLLRLLRSSSSSSCRHKMNRTRNSNSSYSAFTLAWRRNLNTNYGCSSPLTTVNLTLLFLPILWDRRSGHHIYKRT